ncbi:MAG: AhpC/TSA family protein [Actinomycetota bacterium]
MICRAHLVKVVEWRDRVDRAGGSVVFVVHDPPDRMRASMLQGLEVPYPVLLDLERVGYRDWGLGRASFARVYLDPKVWLQYSRLLLRSERLRRPGRDTRQLGGDFVVSPDGDIAYSRPQRADDRPPVTLLLRELERAGGAGR